MTELLTFEEVQAKLKIPVSTVYMLLRRHGIKRVRLGKRVRYRPQDIEGLVQACLEPKRSARF